MHLRFRPQMETLPRRLAQPDGRYPARRPPGRMSWHSAKLAI
jgi:hypothetical protein